MAKVLLGRAPRTDDPAELAAYIDRLTAELEFILSNLDEENMTAAYNSRVSAEN